MRSNADGADTPFRIARTRFAPGLVFGQKLTGRGAWEQSAVGSWVQLSDGKVMLDFGSYAVSLFGHRHPEIIDAVRAQLDRMPTSTRALLNPSSVKLAEELVTASQAPGLSRVWFGLNGSDAVEVVLKLARAATNRPRVLAVEDGFHGKTLGALAVTAHTRYRARMESSLAPVTHLSLDQAAVQREVSAGDVAALIFEPIQGEGGVRPIDPSLLRQWSRDAQAAGAFVVSDEIQVGMGRCGPMSLAVHLGLEPDALLLGKALGGGVMPLSAAVLTERIHAPLTEDPLFHTSTFSGHPLSCAAGLAAVKLRRGLALRTRTIESILDARLRKLVLSWPELFTEHRGMGLLWGIECTRPEVAGHFLIELNDRGLLVSPCLGRPEVIRLLPPATVRRQELDFAFKALARAAASTHALVATQ